MKIVKPSVELWSITQNAEKLIERAGRICYKSEDQITEDSAPRFIQMLLKRGHLSVLEHASATMLVTCDRGISHEIVRHRLAAYSQSSTRYCNYGKQKFGSEISVIEPPGLIDPVDFENWLRCIEECENAYMELISNNVKPEIARSVLPTCTATELVVTKNFRAWLHFFKTRCSPAAHPQAREIAFAARDILVEACPSVFSVSLSNNR